MLVFSNSLDASCAVLPSNCLYRACLDSLYLAISSCVKCKFSIFRRSMYESDRDFIVSMTSFESSLVIVIVLFK